MVRAKGVGAKAQIRVGIGGWVFPPWRGVFYPKGLPQAQELSHASRQVTAIEINATFYGSQKPASFRRWYSETPDDFVFSVKGPRLATIRKVLAEVKPSIDRFFSSGVLELKEKLGPILWQFAAFKRFEPADFAAFLDFLPHELDGLKLRHVVEVRHESFATPEFVELLRRHGVALALVDGEDRPVHCDITADFIYARLERAVEAEPAGYPAKDMKVWAKRFQTWAGGAVPSDVTHVHPDQPERKAGRDCFVYFISGAKVRNPAAAQRMLKVLADLR